MYVLLGLAEGLVGASTVKANSANEVFAKYPILNSVKNKLEISNRKIKGFAACDG